MKLLRTIVKRFSHSFVTRACEKIKIIVNEENLSNSQIVTTNNNRNVIINIAGFIYADGNIVYKLYKQTLQ